MWRKARPKPTHQAGRSSKIPHSVRRSSASASSTIPRTTYLRPSRGSRPPNPHNWSPVLIGAIPFIVGWASSIDSGALDQAAAGIHEGRGAETLATGIYLIGIGVGSLFAGPLSETFERNIVYVVTMALCMPFVTPSGLAPNFGAQIALRFHAGFFGSALFTCAVDSSI
ncbi:hypothetical protein HWV62_29224 [Athelia sp. TMB]|nr:hypothetical protein HWV62_29224 [Athelia sp. TMB]